VQNPITGKWVQKGTSEAAGLGGAHKDFDAGLDWDRNLVRVAGRDIDFVALHWYPGATTESSGFKDIDSTKTLLKPEEELPR
jgi:hypothetical protein